MNIPAPTRKQARLFWAALSALSVVVLLVLVGLLFWGLRWTLSLLAPVLWPLAIAGILAYLLDPVVDYFERKNVKRTRAIWLVIIMGVVLLLALGASVVPRLVVETSELIDHFPDYRQQLEKRVNEWIVRSPFVKTTALQETNNTPPDAFLITNPAPREPIVNNTTTNAAPTDGADGRLWTRKIGVSLWAWLEKVLPKVGAWLWSQLSRVASWFGILIGMAMVPVFTFYFLLEKTRIRKGWTNYLPVQESRFKDELVFVLRAINDYLIVFFRSQVLVAICDGVLYTIGFLGVGLNYALLIGVLAGLLSIIPYLGAILTIVPAVILAIVQFHDWLHPLLVVAVFCGVQMLEAFVISPHIMGDRIGLHPLTIMVSVLVGTILMGGILGGVLAIPLTATLRVLMFRYVWRPRSKGGQFNQLPVADEKAPA